MWVAVAAVLRTGRTRVALGALAAAPSPPPPARIALVAMLARSGWWFVEEKVLLTLPLVVLPGLATAALSARALLVRCPRTFTGSSRAQATTRGGAAFANTPGMSFRRRLATRRLDHAITPATFVATAPGDRRPGRAAAAAAAAAAGGGVAGVLGTFVVGYPVTPAAAVLLPLMAVVPAVAALRTPRVVRAVGVALVALLVGGLVAGAW
jgi:hypothetical protein